MEDKSKEEKALPKKYSLAMILCCLIPLVAIVILSALGILGNVGFLILLLLCPLLHFLMMGKRRK